MEPTSNTYRKKLDTSSDHDNMIKEEEILASSDSPTLDFGIDPQGPIPDEDFGTIEVPETLCSLDEDGLQYFMDAVDTQSWFEDMCVQHYISCKQLFESLLQTCNGTIVHV